MTSDQPPVLKSVSAKLSPDGSVDLAGTRLWMVPAEERDKPYIISTWVASYKLISKRITHNHMSGATKHIKSDAFQETYPRLVEALWQKSLVVRDEAGTACHGYICGSPPGTGRHGVLHYMYLPPELRSVGLGKAMWTHLLGPQADRVMVTNFLPWKHWPKGWEFNPYGMMV